MRKWVERELGAIADIRIGGTPARANLAYWSSESEDGTPWASISDLHGRFIGRTKEQITSIGAKNSNVKLLPKGSLILSFKLSLGKAALTTVPLYTNEAIAAIEPKADGPSTAFLYYVLPEVAANAVTDTAIKGATLNKKSLFKLNLRYPEDADERMKIANILETVDEAIEHTEALIGKYERIKTGMMQDLFTRGLTPDGKLRPPRETAPELYKETQIGWLPKEWSTDLLHNLLDDVPNNMRSGPFGSALLKSELTEDGVPLLGIDNVFHENFVSNYSRYVSERKFSSLLRYAVRPRDVVITIMGTVGRCAVIPYDIGPAMSSKHLWCMTFNENKVCPELVCWQLNHAPWVSSWFRRKSQGGIMNAIQSSTLRTLRLPVPKPDEQNLIFERYRSLSEVGVTHQEHLQKLRQQKSGLMDDLLTGRVEVTV